jgi:molybdopterin-guanine dinucleotide biosynthesis protein B
VTDPKTYRSLETGMRLIERMRRLSPARFRWRTEPYEFDRRPAIDLLTGSRRFRETVERGEALASEIVRQDQGAVEFLARREPHLLYPDRRPAVVAFVGPHNAGKTTLVVELVPRLSARGFTVATVKHTSKDVEDDVPGKDSHRHAHSGAAASALVTPERTTARRLGGEEGLDALVAREFSDCDLVLVEGYKSLPVPKIQVHRVGLAAMPIDGASLRVSDEPSSDGVPTISFDDHDGLAAAVLRLAGLDRAQRKP